MRSRLVLLLLLIGVGTARADELDVHTWLEARGISADPERSFNWQNAMCSEVAVGPHREAALQCYEEVYVSRPIPGEAEPANRNVVHVVLRVVRAKKLVTLIDVPVRTFSEDAQPRPITVVPPPWHPFEIAKDGLSIVVGDPDDAAACKRLASAPRSKGTTEEQTWAALRADLEGGICRAGGRYVWAKGMFSRKP